MELITQEQSMAMLANGERTRQGEEIDPFPVVKLFNPLGLGTWLLTEIDPDNPDMTFGLCDLGFPEVGSVYLPEMMQVRLPFGMGIERDIDFEATKTLSQYADEARAAGRIIA